MSVLDKTNELIVSDLRAMMDSSVQIPRKPQFLFSVCIRNITWRQFARVKDDGAQVTHLCDVLSQLWSLLAEIVCLDSFDPQAGFGESLDHLMKLVFDEYERGSLSSKKAACLFLRTLESRPLLARAAVLEFQKLVGGRKSPSFESMLSVLVPDKEASLTPEKNEVSLFLLEPVFRMVDASAKARQAMGVRLDKELFGHTGQQKRQMLRLVRAGRAAWSVVCAALFPHLVTGATRKAERKKREAWSEGRTLLREVNAEDGESVAPFLAFAVSYGSEHLEIGVAMEVADEAKQLLGGASHEMMGSVVEATAKMGNEAATWRRDWCWELVTSWRDRNGSGWKVTHAFARTCAAIARVEPSLAFQLVSTGLLERSSSDCSTAQAQDLVCAIIWAYAELRALPELYQYLLQGNKSGTIRDAFALDGVRASSRDALRRCLPVNAQLLALVPRDATSSVMVCDILKWGPIGPEAEASGWNPVTWTQALCRHVEQHSDHVSVYREMMNALHYRWTTLVLGRVMKMRQGGDGFFSLLSSDLTDTLNSSERMLCILQRLRLSRDFPQFWSPLPDAESICKRVIDLGHSLDWGVLLWCGGLTSLQQWLLKAPESMFKGLEAIDAWGPGGQIRADLTVKAMTDCDVSRARCIAEGVPTRLLKEASDTSAVVRALYRVDLLDKLGELVEIHRDALLPVVQRVWVKEMKPLGPRVAVAVNDETIWKACRKLPRPQLWSYLAVSPKMIKYGLKALKKAGRGAWNVESGCWDLWISVLNRIEFADWSKRLSAELVEAVFVEAWKSLNVGVICAMHGALFRLQIQGGLLALKKCLYLVLKLHTKISDAALLDLLGVACQAEAGYKMVLECVGNDQSCRVLYAFLMIPFQLHKSLLLRSHTNAFVAQLLECPNRVVAARSCGRLIRICPPYNANELALLLQPCLPGSDATSIRASMTALSAARRVCPRVWFRGIGIVSAIESRAMYLVSHIPEQQVDQENNNNNNDDWVRCARSVGREIGAGGSELKKRKLYLTYALADWLTRCEHRAALSVRRAVWEEGMVVAMEAVRENDGDKAASYALVRGPMNHKSAWKRYKRKYEETEFKGKV